MTAVHCEPWTYLVVRIPWGGTASHQCHDVAAEEHLHDADAPIAEFTPNLHVPMPILRNDRAGESEIRAN